MTKRRKVCETLHADYEVVQFDNKRIPKLLVGPIVVPLSDAAVLETLSEPRNIGRQLGTAFVIARGGTISLDGARIHHVRFINVEIQYSGKPTDLQDVVFVNCRFVLDNAEPSRMLALEILSANKVSFSISA